MAEQHTKGYEPPPSDDWGHIAYNRAGGYLAGRQLEQEGLSWIYFGELEAQWSAVMNYVSEHELERLSIRRRIDAPDGGPTTFVAWHETGAESDQWAHSMWVPIALLDDILNSLPPADLCEGTRVIEQERLRRDGERDSRRARGFLAIWEAAREAAPAMRMEEFEVLAAIQQAASRGQLPAYMHGASLPIHAVVGASVHPKHECSAEDLDNWMRANQVRCDFSFVARAQELARAQALARAVAAGEGTSTPRNGNPVVTDAARWKQADAAGKRALAEDAVRRYGSQAGAARACGVSRARLQAVLDGTRGAKSASARGAAAAPGFLDQVWNRRGR